LVETDEGAIRFVDTAGMRRKSHNADGTEYFALVRAL
jgi:GTP-binding protein